MAERTRRTPARYRVLIGIDYMARDTARRVEPGEIADDVPATSVPWLLELGAIASVEEGDGG